MWYSKAFSCNCGCPHSSSSFVHLLLPLLLLLLLLLSPLLLLLLLLLLPLLLLFEPLLLDLLSLLRDLFLSLLFLIGLGEADLKCFKSKARFEQFWDHRKLTCCQTFLSSVSSRPCHHHHSHFLMNRRLCLSWVTQLQCCSRMVKQVPACCWNIRILTIAPRLWRWSVIGDELLSLEFLNNRYSNSFECAV